MSVLSVKHVCVCVCVLLCVNALSKYVVCILLSRLSVMLDIDTYKGLYSYTIVIVVLDFSCELGLILSRYYRS